MEVALTFGSVGDIIQLCQLAIRLRRAIGAGVNGVGESELEYQELRDELDTLVKILIQVVATYEQYESSAYLEGLDDVAKNVVEQCVGYIKEALEHFEKRYQTSLHPGGSGNRIRDVFKKVEWSTREGDRIKALRGRLRDGIQRLSLIGNLVAEKTALVDQATLLARIDRVQGIVAEHSIDQAKILDILKAERDARGYQTKKLEEAEAKLAAQTEQLNAQSEQLEQAKQQLQAQSKQLVVQYEQGRSIFSVAKDALSGILEVKTMLVQVSQNVVNLHAVATNPSAGMVLDPTREMPVMLEDALGRQMPIPAVWLDTIQWETLSMLLNDHFAGQKGHDMVKRRSYALEESASGKELDRTRPLNQNLRRGMTIRMSMVFNSHRTNATKSCPRCGAETIVEQGVAVYCYTTGCGLSWRIDRTIQEKGNLRIAHSAAQRSPWNSGSATDQAVEPGDFQRVHLRQNGLRNPSRWYCRVCRCEISLCSAVTLIHDLVSLPEEGLDDTDNPGDIPSLGEATRPGQWSDDAFFETYDVEWMPEQQPVDSKAFPRFSPRFPRLS